MKVSEVFEKIANIKYENDIKNDVVFNRENVMEKYKKMMISNYEIVKDNKLQIHGVYDLTYDQNHSIDLEIKRDNLKFLLYDLTGHSGEWTVLEFDKLEEVEEYILSPGGILNMFTSEIIVLENLQNKKYKIYEVLENEEEVEVFDFAECSSNIESKLIVKWI